MRLIDADTLNLYFDRRCFSEYEEGFTAGADAVIEIINNAPTVEVNFEKVGEWVGVTKSSKKFIGNGTYKEFFPIGCSICCEPAARKHPYCPNCGAKMEES